MHKPASKSDVPEESVLVARLDAIFRVERQVLGFSAAVSVAMLALMLKLGNSSGANIPLVLGLIGILLTVALRINHVSKRRLDALRKAGDISILKATSDLQAMASDQELSQGTRDKLEAVAGVLGEKHVFFPSKESPSPNDDDVVPDE